MTACLVKEPNVGQPLKCESVFFLLQILKLFHIFFASGPSYIIPNTNHSKLVIISILIEKNLPALLESLSAPGARDSILTLYPLELDLNLKTTRRNPSLQFLLYYISKRVIMISFRCERLNCRRTI